MDVLIIFATLIVFTSALVPHEETAIQDILRRIVELEERGRNQQSELETLQRQNAAMDNEIRQLKEENSHQSRRIEFLEKQGPVMEQVVDESGNDAGNGSVLPEEPLGSLLPSGNVVGKTAGIPFVEEHVETSPAMNIHASDDRTSRSSKRSIRIRQTGTKVAFFATLTRHAEHLGHNQAIVFDNAITNMGDAYNPFTGIFSAPATGVYIFSATVVSDRASALFGFSVNGVVMSHMYAYSTEAYATLSMTAVFYLTPGNQVAIWNEDSDKLVQGFNVSAFSGFLLE